MSDVNQVCFIIAHKYYRGHESSLKYYVENIKKLYPEALTIVVDNNSKYPEDVFGSLRHLPNVVFLTNNYEGKFELGAYKVGIQHIIDNGLVNNYSHYICTQENFVVKNFYDFNKLIDKKTWALPINSMWRGGDGYARDLCNEVLTKIGLDTNNWDKADFCWCSSFIVANYKLEQLYGYLSKIVQTTRYESEAAERYLGIILWELNERRDCGDIDTSCKNLHLRHYDCWNPDIYAPVTSYFRKRVQQRNQDTRDRE